MQLNAIFPKAPRFAETHWPARPLLHHGPLSRLGRLGSARALASPEALLRAAARAGIPLFVERPGQRSREEYVSPDAEDLFTDGAIYSCFRAERIVPAIASLLRSLKRELDLPTAEPTCHAYLSSPGSRVRVHFDRQENLGLHLWGKKRWEIAKNDTIAFPHHDHALGEPPPPAFEGLVRDWPRSLPSPRTIVMRPGTALFVPRGMWHSTVTTTTSLSLTVLFPVPSWAELLAGRLRRRLLADARFREPASSSPDALDARLDDFLGAARAVAFGDAHRYVVTKGARLRGSRLETPKLSIALHAAYVPLVRWMLSAKAAFVLADAPAGGPSTVEAARIASFLETHGVLRRRA